jgi:MFS family permease
MTIGMTRTVIPALAENEFGVPKKSFLMLTTFVMAFGFVKGALNFVAGRLSERLGRRAVLLAGWLIAIPIPFLILYARDWSWIVVATTLLGINQGLTWSMTQTAKLDITRPDQRGLTIGLNEFSGYLGVAIAGIATAYLAEVVGARNGLLYFGSVAIGISITLTLLWGRETLPWALAENRGHLDRNATPSHPRFPKDLSERPTTSELFALMTFRDRRMFAFSQAGLVEKFVDALIWIFYPIFLMQKGVDLPGVGWIVGVYGLVWGGSQLFTGRLSDHIGRMRPIVWGMWLCGVGVSIMLLGDGIPYWSAASAITGFGMALLYPNISAAVSDISRPAWRGSTIGIYRFWRDSGYGIGALALGLIASVGGGPLPAFLFVAASMFLSGAVVLIFGDETHPVLNPER